MAERASAIARRELLLGAGAFAALAPTVAFAQNGATDPLFVPAQTRWSDPPQQAPAEANPRSLGHARLFAWDTGGPGQAIVLLHPMTGSHAVWPYQQPIFAAAGYRVIGYSRRGFFASDPLPADGRADDADDLRALLDYFDIDRAHLVASAAGGFVALDFAARFPERVRTLVTASTLAVATSPDMRAMLERLLPPGWEALPPEFRELGPSYRIGNPAGTRRWIALERQARHGPAAARGAATRRLDPGQLPPLLCLTGDADLYAPPALMRAFARTIPRAELAVIGEGGHALFWEQPEGFNRTILSFLERHREGMSI